MFEKILKYQKVEGELIKLENELSKSVDREKASSIQNGLKIFHSRLLVLEENAKRVNEAYAKAIKKYKEFNEKLSELEKQLETVSPENYELYEKAHKDFSNIASGLDKEIVRLHNDIQQINTEYEQIMKKSKEDKILYNKHRDKYLKLKSELEPQIAELKAELSKLQKDVDSKLMQRYNHKRENKIFPIFVPLAQNKCGGCRMEISAAKLGSMKNNDFGVIECENCGRIIYTK